MSTFQRPNRVLLTGGTGCLGHRILDELLSKGYIVRATVRPPKATAIKETYPHAKPGQLEIYVMDNLVTGDWNDCLQDVDAVIHVAAPVYHPGVTSQEIYEAAVNGTKRLITAAGASKSVKQFVLTGSVGAFFKPDFSNVFSDVTFDENTYGEIEDVDPAVYPPDATYIASKTISDKFVWKSAEKYPNVDFAVVYPPCVYGSFIPTYPQPTSDPATLNANKFIYELLKLDGTFPPFPVISQVHTADVARIHVKALSVPPLSPGKKKRLIISSGEMPWLEALEYIREKRPELGERLVKVSEEMKASIPPVYFKLDTKMTEEIVGIKQEDMIGWKEMLLEVVDWMTAWEKRVGIVV